MKKIVMLSLSMLIIAEPSHASIIGSDSPWVMLAASLLFLPLCGSLYQIWPPLGIAVFLLTSGFGITLAVLDGFNWVGTNPRHPTVFTYQRNYSSHRSMRESDRIVSFADNDCSDDRTCHSEFLSCYNDNDCRGHFAVVYQQRRQELDLNPHAFDENKQCEENLRSYTCW